MCLEAMKQRGRFVKGEAPLSETDACYQVIIATFCGTN